MVMKPVSLCGSGTPDRVRNRRWTLNDAKLEEPQKRNQLLYLNIYGSIAVLYYGKKGFICATCLPGIHLNLQKARSEPRVTNAISCLIFPRDFTRTCWSFRDSCFFHNASSCIGPLRFALMDHLGVADAVAVAGVAASAAVDGASIVAFVSGRVKGDDPVVLIWSCKRDGMMSLQRRATAAVLFLLLLIQRNAPARKARRGVANVDDLYCWWQLARDAVLERMVVCQAMRHVVWPGKHLASGNCYAAAFARRS